MARTLLTGNILRSGSIPTTALGGGVVSSSAQIVASLPGGALSSSTQVDYTQLQNIPSGIVSSSGQVSYGGLSGIPSGIASSSGQIKDYLPTDTVSSSVQVTTFLPPNTVSSSVQVDFGAISNKPTLVSGSSQIDVRDTTGIVTIATTGSNTFTGIQAINDTTNSTTYLDGAVTIAGGMSVRKDVRVSGSMTVNGLLTAVSMSTQYVTSSQYNVGVSKITLNDDDTVRFAGLSIFDSGSSSPATASIFWDSMKHKFLYENLSGSSYNSAIFIAGPRNYGTLGDEVGLTDHRVPVAHGDDHIDSRIESSSIRVDFPSRLTHVEAGLQVTGAISASGGINAGNGLYGTLQTAAQTNVTSLGTLSSLTVSGTASITGVSNYLSINTTGTPTTGAAALQISINGTNSRTIRMTNTEATGRTYDLVNGAAGVPGNFGLYDDTAGAYRLMLSASGNVGIGTTSPSELLQVGAAATATIKRIRIPGTYNFDGLYLSNATTNGGAKIEFVAHGNANDSTAWKIQANNDDVSGGLTFAHASTTSSYAALSYNTRSMTLTANNQLLINTTSNAGEILTIGAQQNTNAPTGIRIHNIPAQTQNTYRGAYGDILLRSSATFDNNGANGVIYLARLTYITTAGTGNDLTDNVGMWIRGYYDNSGDSLPLYLGGTQTSFNSEIPAVTITKNGNVGIGTTNPSNLLHISGIVSVPNNAQGSGGYRFIYSTSNADSRSWILRNDVNAYGDFSIATSTTQAGSTWTDRLIIDKNGNVGIGGVVPSAWDTSIRAIENRGLTLASQDAGAGVWIASNAYVASGGSYKYIANGYAQIYEISANNGQHRWSIASNNTSGAGASLTATQAMTLDSSGSLLIGASGLLLGPTTPERMRINGLTPTNAGGLYPATLVLSDSRAYNSTDPSSGGGIGFSYKYTSGGSDAIGPSIQGFKENTTDGNYAGALRFLTRPNGSNPVERMRISSEGYLTVNRLQATENQPVISFTDAQDNTGYFGIRSATEAGTQGAYMATDGALFFGRFISSAFTEYMRIDSSGNIGIGVTNFSSKLHVAGTLYVGNVTTIEKAVHAAGSNNVHLELYAAQGDALGEISLRFHQSGRFYHQIRARGYGFRFTQGNNDDLVDIAAMNMYASGSVSVGNTTPRGPLHIGSDFNNGATDAAAINLKQTSTTAATGIYLERSGERKGYYMYIGGALDSLNFQRNNSGTKSDVLSLTRDGDAYFSGNVSVGGTSIPTITGGVGFVLGNSIFVSFNGSQSSPYTSNIQIDVVYNNWGSNNVIGIVELKVGLREYGNTGGTAFGTLYATNTSSAATFSTFTTTGVTTSQCTVTASSPSNYTLRIVIDPTNATDRFGGYIMIPDSLGGTGTAVSSITITQV